MTTTLSKRFFDLLWKLWYPILTRRTQNASVQFLNYGYADVAETHPLPLLPQDETDRPCIQLYHRVAGTVDLTGQNVLEVSCGHGGGASYIARYLHPKSITAIDRNSRAIQLCKAKHHVHGLTFASGNAQALPFPDNAFDTIINIEASHCYPEVTRFFSEVRRVLKPGGHFLYADFRDAPHDSAILQQQLETTGLTIITSEDITTNVLHGMRLNTEKYQQLSHRVMPRFLQKPVLNFAGVKGSIIYNAMESRKTLYLCYHLNKPDTNLI